MNVSGIIMTWVISATYEMLRLTSSSVLYSQIILFPMCNNFTDSSPRLISHLPWPLALQSPVISCPSTVSSTEHCSWQLNSIDSLASGCVVQDIYKAQEN